MVLLKPGATELASFGPNMMQGRAVESLPLYTRKPELR